MTLLDVEIAEQPEALRRLLADLPATVAGLREVARDCTGVTVVARGSSDNAARYGQYLIPLRSGRRVTLATPSLTTVYGRTPDLGGDLVVAVSQSGRSTDIVAVLDAARAQGRPTVALTNDVASPLAAAADLVVDLRAGAERSVAATKSYTTSLLAVAALAVALAPPEHDDDAFADLALLPDLVAATLALATGPADLVAADLATATRAVTVGRGLNLSTAFEIALKITELTATQVVPYSPADLLHGPVGAVGADVPVLLVAPPEAASVSVLDVAAGLRARGAPVHVLARPGAEVPVPDGVPDWLSPVPAVVTGQLLARALAVRRGVDVDHPGGLAKVTVTH